MTKKAKISNTSIKALLPNDKRLNDTEIPGFHARITESGQITYYFYYRINGKQSNLKLGRHGQITPTQARDLVKIKAGEVAHGVDVQEKKKEVQRVVQKERATVLGKFLDEQYREFLETRNPKTAERTLQAIMRGFPKLLNKQLKDISAWDIEQWRTEKRKTSVKPATINSYINPLKGAMSRAVEWGLIEKHDLNSIKSLKVDNSIIRYLSNDEEEKLLSTLRRRDERAKAERVSANEYRKKRGYPLSESLEHKNFIDYLEPLVILALKTGMRKGELLNLKWTDVDFQNKNITVRAENAKSGKTRHIPMHKQVVETLRGWRSDNPESVYLFELEIGVPIKDCKKAWGNLMEVSGIQNFRFHDMRHHFASKLVMASVDLNTVRELLGHQSLEMTLRYAHLAPEHKAQAIALLND